MLHLVHGPFKIFFSVSFSLLLQHPIFSLEFSHLLQCCRAALTKVSTCMLMISGSGAFGPTYILPKCRFSNMQLGFSSVQHSLARAVPSKFKSSTHFGLHMCPISESFKKTDFTVTTVGDTVGVGDAATELRDS